MGWQEPSGTALFLLGLRGSMVLDQSMQYMEHVPVASIYDAESTPPRHPAVLLPGSAVRVQMADTASRPQPSAVRAPGSIE